MVDGYDAQGLQYMFDEIMGYDSEGEEEDECPGYGKMCQLRRFRMSGEFLLCRSPIASTN